jgi:hypothetical protein
MLSTTNKKGAGHWGPAPGGSENAIELLEPELGGQHHYAASDHRALEGAVSAGRGDDGAVDLADAAELQVR